MGRAGGLRFQIMPLAALAVAAAMPRAAAGELTFPAACTLGVDCFIQMLPDIDPGRGAVDPFCGSATRDGYPGTDIRLQSMTDMRRGVAVLAMAGGTVIEARDGLDDRLVRDGQGAAAVAGRECGNGLAIDHGDGVTAHYCHLRRASLAVRAGEKVRSGQKIGEIGASGLAAYPHLHVAVRRDGRFVDPFSGVREGDRCLRAAGDMRPLIGRRPHEQAGFGTTRMLGAGLTGTDISAGKLTLAGPPPTIDAGAEALVAWSWFINLRPGDRIKLTLYGPAGGVVAAETTRPLRDPRPEFAVYAGRSGRPVPGRYRIVVELLRDGGSLEMADTSVDIAG
ncbi:MAG: peptidoglycan DD-metalloendopeptidase family protein [Rhizobiaceae bacterium]